MAEKYVSFSPYNYCFNNPISWVDPTGMMPEWLQPMWDATNWGEMTVWENGNGGFSEVARFAISGMGGDGGGNGFVNLANGGTILVGGSVADGYRYAKQGQTVSESTPLLTASLYGATSNNSHGDINWTKIVGHIDGNTVILDKPLNVFAEVLRRNIGIRAQKPQGIWSDFPQRDYSIMTKGEQTAHIFNAIRYSMLYGDGTVNMHWIFSNFHPWYGKDSNLGFDSGVVHLKIGDRRLAVQLKLFFSPNINGEYNPVIDFGPIIPSNVPTGPYEGYYWHWFKQNDAEYRWGVGKKNIDWSGSLFLYDWLGY